MPPRKAIALDANPFFYFKTRYFFLWYFLIPCGVFSQLVLIDLLTPLKFFVDRQNLDFIEPLFNFLVIVPTFAL